jgi:hypothetical protein
MIKLTLDDYLTDSDLSVIFYRRHKHALHTITRFMYGNSRKLAAITLALVWA